MAYNRYSHSATLLNNGKVLVAGGGLSGGQTIAELYDPSAGTFTTTGVIAYDRDYHTATLLNNGKVLVAGSFQSNDGRSIAELYDPATGTFTTTGSMTYERYYHSATLLNSGRVLVAGSAGFNDGQSIAELYTPRTYDIYAQKVNLSGVAQWGSDVKVNSDSGNRTNVSGSYPSNYDHLNPKVELDSTGDAVVVWQESRNSVYGDDIYGQKLDTSTGNGFCNNRDNEF
jgi:hypothetical protein